jgi:hypothetical protein
MAIRAGYLMTTVGKANQSCIKDGTRICERMGMNYSSPGKRIKSNIKLKAFAGRFPYSALLRYYRKLG